MKTIEEIKKELSKYSRKVLEHFEETFPCENYKFEEVEIFQPNELEYIDGVFLTYESAEDLWKRWNKYLKLRIFL